MGLEAIVATNTLAQPTPDDPTIQAGVGGGELFEEAIMAVAHLRLEKIRMNYDIDIVGCGGVVNGLTYRDYRTLRCKSCTILVSHYLPWSSCSSHHRK